MRKVFKFRVILDVEQDVFRDIEILGEDHLESLHKEIIKSFSLPEGEMASFYVSDEHWTQGDEISLEDFGGGKVMRKTTIENQTNTSGNRLLYVYDFLNMWTFFIELMSTREAESEENLPATTLTFGERPQDAPEKDFEGDGNKKGLFDDAFGEDEDDFGEEGFEDEFSSEY